MLLVFLLIFAVLALALVQVLEQGQPEPELSGCHCPGCGYLAERDWLICPRCKEMLQVSCRRCRQRIPVFHHYCDACGSPRSDAFTEFAHDDQV